MGEVLREGGWWKGDYYVLFDAAEVERMTNLYGIERDLPGYKIIGLKGWDDFIVRGVRKDVYSVPTVPEGQEERRVALVGTARGDRPMVERNVQVNGQAMIVSSRSPKPWRDRAGWGGNAREAMDLRSG